MGSKKARDYDSILKVLKKRSLERMHPLLSQCLRTVWQKRTLTQLNHLGRQFQK